MPILEYHSFHFPWEKKLNFCLVRKRSNIYPCTMQGYMFAQCPLHLLFPFVFNIFYQISTWLFLHLNQSGLAWPPYKKALYSLTPLYFSYHSFLTYYMLAPSQGDPRKVGALICLWYLECLTYHIKGINETSL